MGERGRDGLRGPPGEKGLDGAPGQHGRDGMHGAPGKDGRDGRDAYQAAVAKGVFVGTEDEWLAHLKGEKGDKGDQGIQGERGGAPGKDGRDGKDGATGQKGADGARGPQGEQGPRGYPGKDGRTILNGNGPPSNDIGEVGDYYIDNAVFWMYGPKTEAGWGLGRALRGRTGSSGASDPVGTGTGGGGTWGSITGTLSAQTDLQAALDAKQNSLGYTAENAANKSTSVSSDGASDTKYPSAKAVKTYADAGDATTLSSAATAAGVADAAILASANAHAESLVVGLVDDRGNFDASGNAFPSSGGSGTAGAILKGDLWTVSVAGTLGGHAVTAGDLVRALSDSPGSTDSNWAITENNLGYVAENAANKNASGGYAGLTLFKLNLVNALGTVTSWFTTAATSARTWTMPDKDGTVAMVSDITGTNSGTNTGDETGARIATLHHAASAKTTLVDADEVTGGDSAASFGLIRTTWANVKVFLKAYFDTLYPSGSGTSSGSNTGDQDLSAYAPLASPTFTGTPAGPTAAAGTNTTQLATTAYVTAIEKIAVNGKAATYNIVAADLGQLISMTGATAANIAVTSTTTAATFGNGFWFLLENAGTGSTGANKKLVFTPTTSTVDGAATITTYPGDLRMVISDGSNWVTKLLRGGFIDVAVADSVFTFTTPTGWTSMRVDAYGAGGSGGGGEGRAAGVVRSGGGGGGGAKRNTRWLNPGDMGSSVTCTVGAGAGTANGGSTNNGSNGGVGNNSTFGTLLTAYGGGAGAGGGQTASTGGGGGGGGGPGAQGGNSTTSTGATGGGAFALNGTIANTGTTSEVGAGGGTAAAGGGSSLGGGAGGGGAGTTGQGQAGGSAFRGAAGGGGGGGISALTPGTAQTGGAGGNTGEGTVTTGGGGGTAGQANGGTAAGTATQADLNLGGQGGGGGGAHNSSTGGAGATGTVPGGGGGGGGGGTNVGGAGGNGGAGAIRIWYLP